MYYTDFPTWTQNCWGINIVLNMDSTMGHNMISTTDPDQALMDLALFSEKGISTAELEHEFQCSYHIVKKLLGQVRPDLLQSSQKGRAKYYQIDLNALDNMLLAQALKGQAEETT